VDGMFVSGRETCCCSKAHISVVAKATLPWTRLLRSLREWSSCGQERRLQHGDAAAGRVLLTFALLMCRRFITRGLICRVFFFVCMPKHLPKMMLTHTPCPRACTSGSFDAVSEDPKLFSHEKSRRSWHACRPLASHLHKRLIRFRVTLLVGRLHRTRNLLLARMCPSQSSRLEPAQGLERPAHCSKGLAL